MQVPTKYVQQRAFALTTAAQYRGHTLAQAGLVVRRKVGPRVMYIKRQHGPCPPPHANKRKTAPYTTPSTPRPHV
ncbi:MAG: hypothetical protein VW518_09995, partial [Burkholderiaceae bacterium]